MAQPSPVILLVCPKCGRKYSSEPGKLSGKPVCQDDGSVLVLPENDSGATLAMGMDTVAAPAPGRATDAATLDFSSTTASMQPTVAPSGSHQERPSVVSQLRSVTSAASTAAAPATKYAISGKLGQGGVGEVLLVEDRDLERSVAMKRLLPQPGGTVAEDALTRFLREAQTTGQLEHPNIVPVHDVGLDSQG
ncbi:MAG TPA: hypothetical protein VMS96_14480, partial [Terriglobales bacterium]|nr:hypothetical protein [Terriglobales bacterium]